MPSTVADTDKTRPSRLDSPPPLPPKLADKNAPDLAKLAGTPTGTPPTGQLMQVVLEHAQLAEQILTSLGHMLPQFVPVAAQMIATMRLGVVSSLKGATQNPQQSLAQGAGPAQPPQPMQQGPPQGAPPPQGAAAIPSPPQGQPPIPGAGAG
jgi:hypothetical protein